MSMRIWLRHEHTHTHTYIRRVCGRETGGGSTRKAAHSFGHLCRGFSCCTTLGSAFQQGMQSSKLSRSEFIDKPALDTCDTTCLHLLFHYMAPHQCSNCSWLSLCSDSKLCHQKCYRKSYFICLLPLTSTQYFSIACCDGLGNAEKPKTEKEREKMRERERQREWAWQQYHFLAIQLNAELHEIHFAIQARESCHSQRQRQRRAVNKVSPALQLEAAHPKSKKEALCEVLQ